MAADQARYDEWLEADVLVIGAGVAGVCVRDYDLQIWRDDAWETIVRERAMFYEVRVYDEPEGAWSLTAPEA
jgi:hypothetical protein